MESIKYSYRRFEELVDNLFSTVFRKRLMPMRWLRAHTFNRYHIIDISGQDCYKWGWIDSDYQMELACFKILTTFVETEYPGHVNWDCNYKIRKVRDEILSIYEWWTKGKKQEEAAINILFEESEWSYTMDEVSETKTSPKNQKLYTMNTTTKDPVKYEEYKKRSAAIKIKHEKMLLRLIKVRKYMWT